ncbi:hypothetical protein [Lacticaseibacillus absianus]|uniref:hypothetical protein n=1 Tax=Lacticaseibacillus absianus TaxID=2729623 RepID=UPI0015CBD13D|nr:hypothetical protein [Lacticaseibacillus absianus]
MPRTDRRVYLVIVALIGCLLGWAPHHRTHAITTPILPQVSRWAPAYIAPTAPGSDFVNGFRAPTPNQPGLSLKAGGTLIVPYLYQRAVLNDLWAKLVITLHVWQVSDTAPYVATRVHTQSETHTAAAFTYKFDGRMEYVPPTPGVYFFQFTAGRDTKTTSYASNMVQLEVTPTLIPPTKLTITGPTTVLPALGDDPWWPATATVWPSNATAPLTWSGSAGLRVAPIHGGSTALTPLMPQAINWAPTRAGFPETLRVTSGPIEATHTVLVGGLTALDLDLDQHQARTFTHAPNGLVSLANLLPDATWHYQWFRYSTTAADHGPQLDPDSDTALTPALGVTNASGQTNTLSDDAVALTLNRTGAAMRHARLAQRAGTPDVLQLVLTATQAGHVYTYSTNYAGLSVHHGPGHLTLHAPTHLRWQMDWATFYDARAVPALKAGPVAIRDTRPPEFEGAEPWQLSAQLHTGRAGFPFVLAFTLDEQTVRLLPNGPSQLVAASRTGSATLPLIATATALRQAVDRTHFSATVDWTLTTAIPTLDALP